MTENTKTIQNRPIKTTLKRHWIVQNGRFLDTFRTNQENDRFSVIFSIFRSKCPQNPHMSRARNVKIDPFLTRKTPTKT